MQHPISLKIQDAIREVPDFPKPGINFYDITTILQDGQLFRDTISALSERLKKFDVECIVAIEARGFIFGASMAHALGLPFVPIRKPGKLPHDVESVAYSLEYGQGSLEIHRDAIRPGARVALVDDLLATGGTAKGGIELVQRLGGEVVECLFVVELTFLNGRKKLSPTAVASLVKYSS